MTSHDYHLPPVQFSPLARYSIMHLEYPYLSRIKRKERLRLHSPSALIASCEHCLRERMPFLINSSGEGRCAISASSLS